MYGISWLTRKFSDRQVSVMNLYTYINLYVIHSYLYEFCSYTIMRSCWLPEPHLRPTFNQLVAMLDLLLEDYNTLAVGPENRARLIPCGAVHT